LLARPAAVVGSKLSRVALQQAGVEFVLKEVLGSIGEGQARAALVYSAAVAVLAPLRTLSALSEGAVWVVVVGAQAQAGVVEVKVVGRASG
jgi:hypothetical protein